MKWIPVSESLPPPDTHEVWAYFGSGEPTIVEVWAREGITRGFCHDSCGAMTGVTHWMLPEPPEPPKAEGR